MSAMEPPPARWKGEPWAATITKWGVGYGITCAGRLVQKTGCDFRFTRKGAERVARRRIRKLNGPGPKSWKVDLTPAELANLLLVIDDACKEAHKNEATE